MAQRDDDLMEWIANIDGRLSALERRQAELLTAWLKNRAAKQPATPPNKRDGIN